MMTGGAAVLGAARCGNSPLSKTLTPCFVRLCSARHRPSANLAPDVMRSGANLEPIAASCFYTFHRLYFDEKHLTATAQKVT